MEAISNNTKNIKSLNKRVQTKTKIRDNPEASLNPKLELINFPKLPNLSRKKFKRFGKMCFFKIWP